MTSPRTFSTNFSTCYSWWKFNSEKIFIWMSTSWSSEIWNEKFQNMHHSSSNASLNLKDYSSWKIFIVQIKFNVFLLAGRGIMNTFVYQIGDEGPSSSRMLCKNLQRNWRIKNTLLWGRKLLKTTKIGRITQMSQESWRHYWVFWEQKELRTVGAKNHCNFFFLCFSVRASRKRQDDKKVLCLWLTMHWVFGLVLMWHDHSELSPLRDGSVIPWPIKISQLDREFPSRSSRRGSQ